jgi:hypothetical protein
MPASLASANNGSGSTDGRRKIIMARAARRIFRRWAVQGSNLRPWD